MMYTPNQFYGTRHLTLERRAQLLRDVHADCYKWWVDKLDCNVSIARQLQPDVTFDEIMAKLTMDCHYTFIHRRGYADRKDEPGGMWKWHLEVGFMTMHGVSNYLWILADESLLQKYVDKYELSPI